MPFCKKCGTKLDDDAVFCHICGTPVPGTKHTTTPTQPTQESGANAETENPDLRRTVLRDNISYGALDMNNLPEGYIIEERYKIIRKIGQGGFGAVYSAYDNKLEVEKALKVIPEAVSSDKRAMQTLEREARLMIKLNHPNIVRFYDFHDSGRIKFIDMEYIDGESISEKLLQYENNRMPEKEVKEIAIKVLEGLSYAHNNKVIHRDIKPQNIMITKKGEVKLMDFGIAETLRNSMSRLEQTTSSGTLVYMSPEQIRGKDLGRESDIYSFGATMYEMLSGNPPFYRGDVNYQILNEKPEKIEGVSEGMNAILQKALEKDYNERYRNCGEIKDALEFEEKKTTITLTERTESKQNISEETAKKEEISKSEKRIDEKYKEKKENRIERIESNKIDDNNDITNTSLMKNKQQLKTKKHLKIIITILMIFGGISYLVNYKISNDIIVSKRSSKQLLNRRKTNENSNLLISKRQIYGEINVEKAMKFLFGNYNKNRVYYYSDFHPKSGTSFRTREELQDEEKINNKIKEYFNYNDTLETGVHYAKKFTIDGKQYFYLLTGTLLVKDSYGEEYLSVFEFCKSKKGNWFLNFKDNYITYIGGWGNGSTLYLEKLAENKIGLLIKNYKYYGSGGGPPDSYLQIFSKINMDFKEIFVTEKFEDPSNFKFKLFPNNSELKIDVILPYGYKLTKRWILKKNNIFKLIYENRIALSDNIIYSSNFERTDEWILDANANNLPSKIIYGNENILQLYGDVGGCWGALAYHPIENITGTEIEFFIKNGDEKLTGCHPGRGSMGFRFGKSWTDPGINLIKFNNNGKIISFNKTFLKNYVSNKWYNIKIRIQGFDGGNVNKDFDEMVIKYIIDNEFVNEFNTEFKNFFNLTKEKLDQAHLELAVDEGSAWFKNINIRKY